MRKHIAKALQARSKAVRGALDRYNKCAAKLHPPKPRLEWDDVINYAFLSEFDLLRDSRNDPRRYPWATSEGRNALTLHHRLRRAQEEIKRLDVEIARFATHLHDEEMYLKMKEQEAAETDPALAHHIREYRMVRGRYTASHRSRLLVIAKLPGSSASVAVGRAIHPYHSDNPSESAQSTLPEVQTLTPTRPLSPPSTSVDIDDDDDEEDSDMERGTEDDVQEVGLQMEKVVEITVDEDDIDDLGMGDLAVY